MLARATLSRMTGAEITLSNGVKVPVDFLGTQYVWRVEQDPAIPYVAKLHATRDKHFGNARDMRRLLDRVRERHGRRLRTEGAADPRIITASDIPETM